MIEGAAGWSVWEAINQVYGRAAPALDRACDYGTTGAGVVLEADGSVSCSATWPTPWPDAACDAAGARVCSPPGLVNRSGMPGRTIPPGSVVLVPLVEDSDDVGVGRIHGGSVMPDPPVVELGLGVSLCGVGSLVVGELELLGVPELVEELEGVDVELGVGVVDDEPVDEDDEVDGRVGAVVGRVVPGTSGVDEADGVEAPPSGREVDTGGSGGNDDGSVAVLLLVGGP